MAVITLYLQTHVPTDSIMIALHVFPIDFSPGADSMFVSIWHLYLQT